MALFFFPCVLIYCPSGKPSKVLNLVGTLASPCSDLYSVSLLKPLSHSTASLVKNSRGHAEIKLETCWLCKWNIKMEFLKVPPPRSSIFEEGGCNDVGTWHPSGLAVEIHQQSPKNIYSKEPDLSKSHIESSLEASRTQVDNGRYELTTVTTCLGFPKTHGDRSSQDRIRSRPSSLDLAIRPRWCSVLVLPDSSMSSWVT